MRSSHSADQHADICPKANSCQQWGVYIIPSRDVLLVAAGTDKRERESERLPPAKRPVPSAAAGESFPPGARSQQRHPVTRSQTRALSVAAVATARGMTTMGSVTAVGDEEEESEEDFGSETSGVEADMDAEAEPFRSQWAGELELKLDGVSGDFLKRIAAQKFVLPRPPSPRVFAMLVLMLQHHLSLTAVDDIWMSLVNPQEKSITRTITEFEEAVVNAGGWANQQLRVRSIIGAIWTIFSTKTLESLLDTAPVEPASVQTAYSDSQAFADLSQRARLIHEANPERAGQEFFVVGLGFSTDKYGTTLKQSARALQLEFLNMDKVARNLQFLRFHLAELKPSKEGFNDVLRALTPELQQLAAGVQIWCERLRRPVWVYAFPDLLMGDSQERWLWAGVSAPTGKFSCPSCEASPEDFQSGQIGKLRNVGETRKAVVCARKKRAEGHPRDAIRIVNELHLNERVLDLPILDWPFLPDIHRMVLPDLLHQTLFYFKELVECFVETLSKASVAAIEERIGTIRSELPRFKLAPLSTCSNWNSGEARNFGMVMPHLLKGLVDDKNEVRLWTTLSTLFSVLHAPEVTGSLARAVGALATVAITDVLHRYKREDKSTRCQLNLHSPLHYEWAIRHYGPPAGWDTQLSESSQQCSAIWARKAQGVTKLDYALRHAAVWQTLQIADLEEQIHPTGALEALSQSFQRHAGVQVRSRKDGEFVVFQRMPLKAGTIVCQLYDLPEAEDSHQRQLREFDGLLEYSQIIRVDLQAGTAEVQAITQPRHTLPMKPFDLTICGGSQRRTISLSSIHRAVATLPTWTNMGRLGGTVKPGSFQVVPSRFLLH